MALYSLHCLKLNGSACVTRKSTRRVRFQGCPVDDRTHDCTYYVNIIIFPVRAERAGGAPELGETIVNTPFAKGD